jgi:hypothetical protein
VGYESASGQALANAIVPDVGLVAFGPSVLRQPSPGRPVRVLGAWQKLVMLGIEQLGLAHEFCGLIVIPKLYPFWKHCNIK